MGTLVGVAGRAGWRGVGMNAIKLYGGVSYLLVSNIIELYTVAQNDNYLFCAHEIPLFL